MATTNDERLVTRIVKYLSRKRTHRASIRELQDALQVESYHTVMYAGRRLEGKKIARYDKKHRPVTLVLNK